MPFSPSPAAHGGSSFGALGSLASAFGGSSGGSGSGFSGNLGDQVIADIHREVAERLADTKERSYCIIGGYGCAIGTHW